MLVQRVEHDAQEQIQEEDHDKRVDERRRGCPAHALRARQRNGTRGNN